MALSDPRYKILPLRGTFAALNGEVANIVEGEICYATDQDQYYQKEGGILVAVGATKAQGILADTAIQPGDNVSTLTNDAGYITAADIPGDVVTSVNTQTGDVVLDADDISDASTTNKYTTQARLDKVDGIEDGAEVNVNADWNASSGDAEILNKPALGTAAAADTTDFATAAQGVTADTAIQPGDNISELNNDAGYITSAGAPGTDLSYDAATRVLASSTGTDATLPEVVASGDSGLMTGADKAKLNNIESGATGDQTAAEIKIAYESNADTNAFTDAEQAKLAGIEAGAQVNTVDSVAGKTGDVTLAKGDVGLGNVDNTSDVDKPISTATQSALDLKADLIGGVVPNSQLPSLAVSEYLGTVANEAELLALTGQRGDWAIRTDTGSTWVITTDGGSNLSDWTELATPADAVTSVNGFTGAVVLSASDVGAIPSTELPNLAPSTIDLQAVTDNGSTTTKTININSGNVVLGANGQIATTGNIETETTLKAGDYNATSTTSRGVRIRGGSGQVEIQRDSTQGGSAIRILQGTDQNVNINANGEATFLGNIGAGTDNPQGRLHVFSDDTTRVFFEDGDGRNEIRTSNGNLTFFANQDANANGLGRTIFYRNGNNESMRLDENGNMGIGTSNPKSKLDVIGSARIAEDDKGVLELIPATDANGHVFRFGGGTTDGTEPRILRFVTSGDVERMRINLDGDVGIGTSSPETTLHVAGSTQDVLKLSTTAVNSKLYFESSGTTNQNYIKNTADTLAVITNGAEQLIVDASGKVGIGTGNPDTQLHIKSASADQVLHVESGDPAVRIKLSDSDSSNGVFVAGRGDELTFETNGNNERLRIDSSGNVGIGSSNPQAALYITSATEESLLKLNGQGSKNVYLDINADADRRGVLRFLSAGSTKWSIGRGDSDELDPSSFHISTASSGGNNAKLVIASNGNVGLSVSDPLYPLDVSRTSSGTVAARFASADTSSFVTIQSSTSTINGVRFGAVGDHATIWSGSSESMRVDSNGNVSIGTTTPSARFHVAGTGKVVTSSDDGFSIYRQESEIQGLRFQSNAFGNQIQSIFADNNKKPLKFKMYNSTTDVETHLGLWSTAGDLEIGPDASNPTIKLESDGKGEFAGNVTFSGGKITFENSSSAVANWQIEHDTAGNLDFNIGGTGNAEMVLSADGVSSTTAVLKVGGQPVWTNGNHGTGSGLDADLLDGLQASQFLRSDADDTFSGILTGNANARLVLGGGPIIASTAELQVNGFMRTGTIFIHEGGTTPTTPNLGLTNLSGELQWDGNTVWTEDNDGPNSGLNADLLDGLHSTSFVRTDANSTVDATVTVSTGNRVKTESIQSLGAQLQLAAGESIGKYSSVAENIQLVSESGLQVISPDRDHSNWETGYELKYGQWTGDKMAIGLNERQLPSGLLADVGNPAIAIGDPNTGIRWESSDNFSFYAGNVEKLNIGGDVTAKTDLIVEGGSKVILDGTGSSIGPWELYQGSDGKLTVTISGTGGAEMQLTADGSTQTSATLSVGNRRVLTLADVGSGNGLDADLLDGQEGSHYLDYNNLTNTPTLATVATSGSYNDLTDKPATPDITTGTFTPTWVVSSGTTPTAGTATGTYTKIGDRVMFDLEIDTVDVANSSAGVTVRIGGLPFTSAGKAAVTIGSIVNFDDNMRTKAYIDSGVTEITLLRNNSNSGSETVFATNNLNQGTGTKNIILLSGTYRV